MAAIQNIPTRPQTYSALFLKAESIKQQPAAENTQIKKRKGKKNRFNIKISVHLV